MSDKDLKKNRENMKADGYFKEELKIDVGEFSLDSLDFKDEEQVKFEPEKPKKPQLKEKICVRCKKPFRTRKGYVLCSKCR